MIKQPNFFIIGAPKCGTTSISRWLSEHPEVFFSLEKEPHFFSPDVWKPTRTIKEYEALFLNANNFHVAIGEASTHYIYSEVALPKILKYNSEAKFIVCIRNPIEMAPSMHAERVFAGLENQTDFAKAWQLIDDRRLGKHIPLAVQSNPDLVNYRLLCSLGKLLERVYSQVGKNQVLPVFLDDIKDNPKEEYLKITDFLELSPLVKTSFKIQNSRKTTAHPKLSQAIRIGVLISQKLGKRRRYGFATKLRNMNQRASEKSILPTLDPILLSEMQRSFNPDVELLQSITGKDLSHWIVRGS